LISSLLFNYLSRRHRAHRGHKGKKKENNNCVLLKDNTVIGYYPNTETALSNAQKNGFVMGEFLIQDCITNEEETMISNNQAVI